jgi:hypothetical protein
MKPPVLLIASILVLAAASSGFSAATANPSVAEGVARSPAPVMDPILNPSAFHVAVSGTKSADKGDDEKKCRKGEDRGDDDEDDPRCRKPITPDE